MNDVKLAGRIGNELTLRYTNEQTPVVNVRLAVDRVGHDDPDWVDVTLWGRGAEVLAEHAAVGDQVIITDARVEPATIKVAGKNYTTLTVQARRFEFGAKAARNRDAVPA